MPPAFLMSRGYSPIRPLGGKATSIGMRSRRKPMEANGKARNKAQGEQRPASACRQLCWVRDNVRFSGSIRHQGRGLLAVPPSLDAGAEVIQHLLALPPAAVNHRQHALHEPAAGSCPCRRSSSATTPRAVPSARPRCSSVPPRPRPRTSTATPRGPAAPCTSPPFCGSGSWPHAASAALPLHARAAWPSANAVATVCPHGTDATGETACCFVPAGPRRWPCLVGPGQSSPGSHAANGPNTTASA